MEWAAGTAGQGTLYTVQVVTDRFASPNLLPAAGGDARCWNLNSYCGGTWQGLLDRAEYIKGLHLNAIWSSPVSVQSYGGYHGYWPLDLYALNPSFGTPKDLQRVLHELETLGLWSILDVVLNHVGYNTYPLGPELNPFNKAEHFHDCIGCNPDGCTTPNKGATLEQRWHCRLAWLPDLDQSHSFVRQQSVAWVAWMLGQFSFHGVRVDAAGHVDARFWPWLVNETGLAAWLETVPSPVHLYEQVRGNVSYSYQSYELYSATLSCFAPHNDPATPAGCMQMSSIRRYLASIGVDTRNAFTFAESHDTDRFLAIEPRVSAYRNALAHTLLSEAIPVILYGAEQGLDGSRRANANRLPLWHVGYNTSSPLYIFIRTLAWYRRELDLPSQPFNQSFVDRHTFAFSRGPELLVVLTSGAAPHPPAAYHLTDLTHMAGEELCDALQSGYCMTVSADGTAQVEPSPDDEPLVLVTKRWCSLPGLFVPTQTSGREGSATPPAATPS